MATIADTPQNMRDAKLTAAVITLCETMPLFGELTLEWCKKLTQALPGPTMGIGYDYGLLTLFYHPEFIDAHNVRQAAAVFHHECMHVFLGHLFRREDRHKMKFNLAADLCVNVYIKNYRELFPYATLLPEKIGLTDDQIMDLTVEQVYELIPDSLAKEYEQAQQFITITMDGGEGCSDQDCECNGGDSKADGCPGKGKMKVQLPGGTHQFWDEVPEEIKSQLKVAINQAKQRHPQSWGSMHGGLIAEHEATYKVRVKLPKRLQSKVSQAIRTERRFSLKRAHRSYGLRAMGSSKSAGREALVVIDSSGSVSDELVDIFLSAIQDIRRKVEVTLMICDTEITYTGRAFKKWEGDFGRGGTSFQPPFDWAKENGHKMVIYLTDGYAPMPDTYGIQAIWVLNEHDAQHFNLKGKLVKIYDSDIKKR